MGGQTAALSSNFSQGAWVSFPIERRRRCDPSDHRQPHGRLQRRAVGHLPRRGRHTAQPHVESAPQGKWVGAVGSDGYDLAGFDGANGDVAYLPNATMTLQQGSRWQWAANTTDAAGAAAPRMNYPRNAGTYYDPNQIKMQLSFNEPIPATCTCMRWTGTREGRREIDHGQRADAPCSRATSAKARGSPSRSASPPAGRSRSRSAASAAATPCCRASSSATQVPPPPPKWKALHRANGSTPSARPAMPWPAGTEPQATSPTCPTPRSPSSRQAAMSGPPTRQTPVR